MFVNAGFKRPEVTLKVINMIPLRITDKTAILIILILATVAAFSFQGSRGIYEPTEGRYAECAREMMEQCSYLEPLIDYQPHWTKPPLTYWAIAAGIKILGNNEWGVRFYLAISFIVTVLLVKGIGTTLWDKTTGIVAGLVYVTSIFTVFAANAVSTDNLLTLWETAAVLSYVRSIGRNKQHINWMWLFFGLGFLTKGPPALLPLIPILIWNQRRAERIKIVSLTGLLIFSLTGLSWYLLSIVKHPELLSYWIKQEIVGRVSSGHVHNANKWYAPFILYLPALFLGSWAWLYFPLRMVADRESALRGKLMQILKGRNAGSFLFLWFIIPLTVFSLSRSRLILYVLPVYTPVALGIARLIKNGLPEKDIWKKTVPLAICLCGLLVYGKAAAAHSSSERDMKALYRLCLQFDNNTTFIAYNESKLMGIQFYLKKPIMKISSAGNIHFRGSIIPCRQFMDMISSDLAASHIVIMSRKRYCNRLEKGLHEFGLEFNISAANRFWKFYTILNPERYTSLETEKTGIRVK